MSIGAPEKGLIPGIPVQTRGGIQPSRSLDARSESKSNEPFLVWIVGFEGSVQHSTKYTISASGAPPRVVATLNPSADSRSDALADLLTKWRRREDEARALAGQLASRLPPGAKWVKILIGSMDWSVLRMPGMKSCVQPIL
jgi:hypothetical protein